MDTKVNTFRYFNILLSPIINYLRNKNPKLLFSLRYFKAYGKMLNFKTPKSLYDKIGYLAFCTDTSNWSFFADKLGVRRHVKACGYNECLPQLYGTWENADLIDFDNLPNAFVLKTNNASATNILVRDKSIIDESQIRNQLNEWMKYDYGHHTCQPHYSRIKPLILAEEFLGLKNKADNSMQSLIDYKFFCINGIPKYVQVMANREDNSHNMSCMLYDMNWECHPEYISNNHHKIEYKIQKPISFEKMKEVAMSLAAGLPFVRVDFYEVSGCPIVGEMTFTPGFSTLTLSFWEDNGEECKLFV